MTRHAHTCAAEHVHLCTTIGEPATCRILDSAFSRVVYRCSNSWSKWDWKLSVVSSFFSNSSAHVVHVVLLLAVLQQSQLSLSASAALFSLRAATTAFFLPMAGLSSEDKHATGTG